MAQVLFILWAHPLEVRCLEIGGPGQHLRIFGDCRGIIGVLQGDQENMEYFDKIQSGLGMLGRLVDKLLQFGTDVGMSKEAHS